MELATHTVFSSGSGPGRSAAVSRSEPALGLVAVADATVAATPVGQDLGAAASSLVLDTVRSHIAKHVELRERFAADPTDAVRERLLEMLRTAVGIASREVNALARRRKTEISVTLDVVLTAGSEAFIAHVGDGRVYMLRKGLVHKLTQDHLGPDPIADALRGHLSTARTPLSRALGPTPQVEPETLNLPLGDGDRLFITSPWLYRGLDDMNLREIVGDPAPDGVSARLISESRKNGIEQDLACALVDAGEIGGAAARAGRLATLARIPLFAYCTERELLAIAGVTRPLRFLRGTDVFLEGDRGRGLYLVVHGEVAVIKGEEEIVRLRSGANFGEMSMLDEPERSATVRATEDTELLLITRDAFFSLLKRDPTLAVKVLWNMLLRLSANLRNTSERLREVHALLEAAGEPNE